MATSSLIMLSNISMERLYLSQPPAWNDLQRLPFSLNQQDGHSSQQLIRTCYDKLLHHMYDINSSSTTTTINQINEQLELAAEYCQLKTLRDGNTVYLHSDQFHIEITFDPSTHLPINVTSCFANEERFNCTRMLKALNEKQYKLFREHLNGYASLFTLTTSNNDKRIGYTAYKILQQDLERLSKSEQYGKLLENFQPILEGLPMRIQLDDQLIDKNLSSSSTNIRLTIVSSTNQYYLPIKSSIYIDEKTNQIQLDSSLKSHSPATGHFAIEFDENQPSFILLLTYAQEISRLTNINTFLTNSKTFNYLSTILPKIKSFNQYQWYISHDQLAISIRQIPFTNLKQLIHILNLIQQQIYLTKYFNYYFNNNNTNDDDDHDHMDEDNNEISLELSFLSSTILSITCAQSYHLLTILLQMSNINTLPLLIHRQEQKKYYLNEKQNSLLKLIEQLLKEDNRNDKLLSSLSNNDFKAIEKSDEQLNSSINNYPKFNRRLSCGPPAKPTWRRATTLRRNQTACLTLNINNEEKISDEQLITDDDINQNITTTEDYNDDDDDTFLQSPQQQQQQQPPPQQLSYHPQLLPKPLLSFHPSTLSRCTSVSSTQSVSTPPIFGLSPSTPYPGGTNNSNGNIFFPLGKQVSVPDYSPVTSPMTLSTIDPLVFLPANPLTSSGSNIMPSMDPNNKNQQKKKRRRSGQSPDDFMQTLSNNPNGKEIFFLQKKYST